MGLIICGPRWKGQRPDGQKCIVQTDTWTKKRWTKIIWTKLTLDYMKCGLRIKGQKKIWPKLPWEQRVSGLKDFGPKIFGQKCIDQVGQGLKCFG